MVRLRSPHKRGGARKIRGSGYRGTSLRTQAHRGVDTAADGMHEGVAALRRGARHTAEATRSRLNDAKDGVYDTLEDAKDAAMDAARSVKGVVARNPAVSIGIAAGLIVITSLVVQRLRSRS